MDEKSTVFISYSSKDLETVNLIVEKLESMGVRYWKAPEMIPAGSSYAREIPKAIQECEIFLLILSKHSQCSIWVEKEVDNGICQRKTVIPFQIDALDLNDTFRFYLNNVQMIPYYENSEKAFNALRKKLNIPEPTKQEKKRKESEAVSKVESKGTSEMTSKVTSEKRQTTESVLVKDEKKTHEKSVSEMTIKPNVERNAQNTRRTNALRVNQMPVVCEFCGCEELTYVSVGVYRCSHCGKDNYDDFQKIRNFLDEAGATSAVIIEQETGVPRRTIDYFFRQEYLEIPKNSPERVPCQKCGAPIRTGTLCERCKNDTATPLKRKDTKDLWHSFKQRKIGD